MVSGLDVSATTDDGLIFYLGPLNYNPKLVIRDFMALEVRNGYATLLMDHGTGTVKLEHQQIKLTDGKSHKIEIFWTKNVRRLMFNSYISFLYLNQLVFYLTIENCFFQMVEMNVDQCKMSVCLKMTVPIGGNTILNVNGPLQIGGTVTQLDNLAQQFRWNHAPTTRGFSGCIYNVTFNAMVNHHFRTLQLFIHSLNSYFLKFVINYIQFFTDVRFTYAKNS